MKDYKVYGNERTNLTLSARAEEAYSDSDYRIIEKEDGTYAIYCGSIGQRNLVQENLSAEDVNGFFEDEFIENMHYKIDDFVDEHRDEIREAQKEAYKNSLLYPSNYYGVYADLKKDEVDEYGDDRDSVMLAMYRDMSFSALDDWMWSDYAEGEKRVMHYMTEEQRQEFRKIQEDEDRDCDIDILRDQFPEAYEKYRDECVAELVNMYEHYDTEVSESVKEWKESLY